VLWLVLHKYFFKKNFQYLSRLNIYYRLKTNVVQEAYSRDKNDFPTTLFSEGTTLVKLYSAELHSSTPLATARKWGRRLDANPNRAKLNLVCLHSGKPCSLIVPIPHRLPVSAHVSLLQGKHGARTQLCGTEDIASKRAKKEGNHEQSVGLFWEKSTAGWLLVVNSFWEKSTAGWWLISRAITLVWTIAISWVIMVFFSLLRARCCSSALPGERHVPGHRGRSTHHPYCIVFAQGNPKLGSLDSLTNVCAWNKTSPESPPGKVEVEAEGGIRVRHTKTEPHVSCSCSAAPDVPPPP
jgi:hypothetical protein